MRSQYLKYVTSRIRAYYFVRNQKSQILVCNAKKPDLTPSDVGLVPSPIEYALDNPYTEPFKHCDGIHFVGISSEKHMIDVCINRIEENMTSVWVYLKLSDGSVYKFPSANTRTVSVASENAFSSSGLQIKCLSPMRKWRVSFNGLLEKCDSEAESALVHTRFSFIWLAMSRVQEQNLSYGAKEITDAFIKGNCSVTTEGLKSLYELQNRCEQWGQMVGTIAFSGGSEKEFYFWSMRTRISDSPLWNMSLNCMKFQMYFMDGIPLKLESISVKDFISNLTSGFSVTSSGGVKPISYCNFDIDLHGENDQEINFSYFINGEEKKISISFIGGDSTLYTGPELQTQVKIRPFKVQMNGCSEGFGILHHSVNSNNENEDCQFPPVVLKDPGHSLCDRTCLLLEDEMCRSSLIAGGKGSSLALLTELSKKTNEFVVPRGFVISTKAFEEHLNTNKNVFDAVQRLKDVSCTILNGNLKVECKNCTETFVSTQLSEHLKSEIKYTLGDIYDSLENVGFSVRSSVLGEDSEDLSAAGQMKTLLNVRGIDNVFKAVVECWSSKFSFEAVQYARQNGQSILSPMAVVIQEMVPSDFSGVMFTVDPVSGDPSYPCITANFGLGETVVSSAVDPDTIKLKREKDQSLHVFEVNVGSKIVSSFIKTEGGIEERKCESQTEKSCLTNEWAIKIGKAGLLIESCFCSPRDIEWAVSDDHLYLLQARPITTLHKETKFELIHDQDTPVRSHNDFWTTANVGEVYSGALSPLGISLIVGGMDIYGYIDQISMERRSFSEFCPYFFHVMPVMQRHIAMNLIDILLKSNEKEVTPIQRAVEIALFGRSVITEEIHQAGVKKHGYATLIEKIGLLMYIPMLAFSIPRDLAKVSKEVKKYRLPLETYTSAKKTWDGILNQMILFNKVRGVHGMTTFLSSVFNMVLLQTLKKDKKEWDTELYSDFATLLSSSGAESVDVPGSLQELARTIALNYGKTFSSLSVHDAYGLLKSDVGTSGKLFEQFIEKHGHRGTKEFDVYSKSWRMDSEGLIHTLQNMVRAPNIFDVTTKEVLDNETILSTIRTPLNGCNKAVLKFFLPRCRNWVCLREESKFMLIKTIDWLRESCYHLGDLMVKEGMLPEKELVFFLTIEEIQEVLHSQKPGLVHKATRREQLHRELNEVKFPEIIKGIPKPVPVKDYSSDIPSFALKGTPVCQGTVKGKAVVALTLEEASKIESGDILITYATDIGWSPYFPLLSGVVTVLGGLISHGAVVAREFGLPCVVAVQNATTAFKSGDIVVLNGTEGTVTKVLNEK